MAFRNSLNENENEKNRQLLYLRNSFAAAGKNDQSKQPHNEGFIRRYRDQSQLKNASEIKSDITAEATKLNKLLESFQRAPNPLNNRISVVLGRLIG